MEVNFICWTCRYDAPENLPEELKESGLMWSLNDAISHINQLADEAGQIHTVLAYVDNQVED